MKATLILAAVCAMTLAPNAPAKANVMYTLVVDSLTPHYSAVGVAPTVSYYTTDGSASVSEVGGGQYTQTMVSSASGYVSITINGATSTTGYSFGTLLFATDWTSITISFLGEDTDLRLSGSLNDVSGSYGADSAGCNGDINACSFTGHFVQVPEPASLLLLSAGLFGAGVIGGRNRHQPTDAPRLW